MIVSTFFRRDVFSITSSVLNRSYVKLSSIPEVNSIFIFIEYENSLLTSSFDVIQINETNVSQFPEAVSGDYVISWINSDTEIKNIITNATGKKLQVQYVTNNADSLSINQIDYTNWDNSVKFKHESIESDGSNTITLEYYPIDSSLKIFINGIYQTLIDNYTVDGKEITFSGTVPIGAHISLIYMY